MSDIQRWTLPHDGYAFQSDDGGYVTYADHVAAVAAARAPKWEDCDATGEDFTDAWGRVWVRKDWHLRGTACSRTAGP